MIRVILALAAGHIRMEFKSRYTLFWMILMPVVFIAMFGSLFRDEGPRKLELAVVDSDQSFLSQEFVEILRGEELAVRHYTAAEADTSNLGRRVLMIPTGFSDSLANGDHVGLPLKTRRQQMDPSDFAVQVHIYKAVARMLTNLAVIDSAGSADTLAVESEEFQARLRGAGEHPDLIQTDVQTAGRGKTVPTGFAGSAQSMLVLFLLMNTAITGAVVLTQERQGRVLSRLATLPVSRTGLLAGRILGLLGLAVIQGLIILAFGRFMFGVSWGTNPIALIALIICLGLAAAALGIFLGAILRTPEQASSIAWIIPLFLGAIGGCWWPLEIMPQWMQTVGHISPAAWAMDGMHGLISFGKGGSAVIVPGIVLVGYAVVLTLIGARLLRTSD